MITSKLHLSWIESSSPVVAFTLPLLSPGVQIQGRLDRNPSISGEWPAWIISNLRDFEVIGGYAHGFVRIAGVA